MAEGSDLADAGMRGSDIIGNAVRGVAGIVIKGTGEAEATVSISKKPQNVARNIVSPAKPDVKLANENGSVVRPPLDVTESAVPSGSDVQAGSNLKPQGQVHENTTLAPDSTQLLSVEVRPGLQEVEKTATTNLVFFDLETTSFKMDCDITQLAAVHQNETFSQYVMPLQPIEPKASEVTGLMVMDDVLYFHGKPVESRPAQVVLQEFLEWLKLRSPVLLIAHNARFDYVRLFHAITQHNLEEAFQQHVVGFGDTLGLFRKKYPGLCNYKQETLVKELLKESYEGHNAVEDVRTLQKLFNKTEPHAIHDFSCTFQSAYHRWQFDMSKNNKIKENLPTFYSMIRENFVSKYMAMKMAASELRLTHLKEAFEKGGLAGLMELLSQETTEGKPRVTKTKNVIEKMSHFFSRPSTLRN